MILSEIQLEVELEEHKNLPWNWSCCSDGEHCLARLLHLSLSLLPDRLEALALSNKLAGGFVGVPDAAPLEKAPKRLSLTQTLYDRDSRQCLRMAS